MKMLVKHASVGVLLCLCLAASLAQEQISSRTTVPVTKVSGSTAAPKNITHDTKVSVSINTSTSASSTSKPQKSNNGTEPDSGPAITTQTAEKTGLPTTVSPDLISTDDGSQAKKNQTSEITVKSTTPNPSPTIKTQENGTQPDISAPTTANATGNITNPSTTSQQTPKPDTSTVAPNATVNKNNTGISVPSTLKPSTGAPKANETGSSKPSVSPVTKSTSDNNTSSQETSAPTAKVNNTSTSAPSTKDIITSTGTPHLTTEPPTSAHSPKASSTQAPHNGTSPAEKSSTNSPVTKPSAVSKPTTQNPVTTTSNATFSTESPTAPPGSSSQGPSTAATGNDKVYINEIMVNKNGGFETVELLLSASADVSHYAMVIVDGGTSQREIINLKEGAKQNNVLTVSINSTWHVMKDSGTGIAVYDTNIVTNLADTNWKVSGEGMMDALVIGKTYDVSESLSNMTGNYPFVVNPALYGKLKTISRCSQESLRSADMFILTNSSLGRNNDDVCNAKMNILKTLVLKFNAGCDTVNKTMERKIMKYVVREVNKNCQCGITQLHVRNIENDCCLQETLLKIKFVIPVDDKGAHLLDSYEKFIDEAPKIGLSEKTYQFDKNCDDFERCCHQYKCCQQPQPVKLDNTAKNVRVTVAAVVSCLLVFMIIVVIVVIYMKRKKVVNYQFRMSRLREDDDDEVMIGHAEADDFVGGQEATFDIKA